MAPIVLRHSLNGVVNRESSNLEDKSIDSILEDDFPSVQKIYVFKHQGDVTDSTTTGLSSTKFYA